MKTIQIKKPLMVIHGVLTPLNNNFHSRIEADCEGVSIIISGMRDVVDRMLAPDATPSDPHSLIQRALSALGYVVGDHRKDVAQFSRWVDHLITFPRSEEAKAIWTEAMLRLFGSDSPPLVQSTIAEASGACGAFVVEQMRLFPPRISGMDLGTEAWTELQEWRSAAKASGIDSPAELSESGKINFGQLVDRKVSRDWQLATQCDSPKDAESLRAAWHSETNCMFPKEAGDKIRTLKSALKLQESRGDELVRDIRAWEKATGADSPEAAIGRARVTHDSWQEATGAVDSHAAYKKINDLETKLFSYASEIDALRKVTQSTKRDPVTVELDHGTPLTSNGKTIGIVLNPERELAKVKAELDSKRRECATEKERADAEFRRRVDAEKYLFDVDSAQFEFTRSRSGYAQLAAVISAAWKQTNLNCAESIKSLPEERQRASAAESMFRIEQQKHDDTKKELLAANQKLASAIIPLPKPESVEPGQKWARLITTRDPGDVLGSPSEHYVGSVLGILYKERLLSNLDGWVFLGKS